MEYVYAGMWLVVGLILIFRMSKENKIFYFAGGYFIFLGIWWVANALLPDVHLFTGGWGLALRIITGAALAVFCIVFFRDYQRTAAEKQKAKENENENEFEKTKEEQGGSSPRDGGANP
jgi:membrane protein implicated in regulation of membrane protease activity